jgi:nitrite reductase (NO-forming)
MAIKFKYVPILVILTLLIAACSSAKGSDQAGSQTRSYTFKTSMPSSGGMVFTGVGGEIDEQVNPTLKANSGDTLEIKLIDGDRIEHNIVFPDFKAESSHVSSKVNSTTVRFKVNKAGTFSYFCNLPGHRQAGMEGNLVVASQASSTEPLAPSGQAVMGATDMPGMAEAPDTGDAVGADIVRDPTDLPGPIANRAAEHVRIDLEAVEVAGQLAKGTTFTYWTFNGKVPGPFFRVRVNDTVEVHLKNNASSSMAHSVDFHAVTGPGGGAVMTTTAPGGETMFTFKALVPGLYVYHCATPMVAEHIANGMYGMILVEPEGGLPKVDREFYVMQGEIYTQAKYGVQGQQLPDMNKLLNEQPEYFVFNGAIGGLTTQKPLKANVGEEARIFFGVGGPNFISSFHVIGEIMDRVYNLGSVDTPPMTGVQTTLVPPGGAAIVEIQAQVPGKYILVDHALARMERGLSGWLIVDGMPAPDIFNGTPVAGSGH